MWQAVYWILEDYTKKDTENKAAHDDCEGDLSERKPKITCKDGTTSDQIQYAWSRHLNLHRSVQHAHYYELCRITQTQRNICPVRRGWGSCASSAWRRDGLARGS